MKRQAKHQIYTNVMSKVQTPNERATQTVHTSNMVDKARTRNPSKQNASYTGRPFIIMVECDQQGENPNSLKKKKIKLKNKSQLNM